MSIFQPEHELARSMLRRWCQTELASQVEALEAREVLPYPLVQSFAEAFGLRDQADALPMRWEKEAQEAFRGEAVSEERAARRLQRKKDQVLFLSIMSWELCRVCPGFCFALGASMGLAGGAIEAKGTLAQKKRWALPILRFDRIGAWGLTEPEAGSDALGGMQTKAVRVEGGWRIKGQKRFITNAPFADIFVIYARMEIPGDSTLTDAPRVGAFVLERGMPGLETSRPLKKMGLHSSPTGDIFLEDVLVSDEHLLGGELPAAGRGGGSVVQRLAVERAAMIPMCLGILERCMEIATAYAKERTQFGQPIASFQLIQAHLARMRVAYENALSLFYRLVEQQALGTLDLTLACAAKLYVAEATTKAALDAIQILGGNGYMQEYQVEMFARDAKLFEIGGGTNEIQLLTIAREMLK